MKPQEQIKLLEDKVAQLEAQLAGSIDEVVKQQIDAANAKIVSLEKELEDANEIIAEQGKKITELESNTPVIKNTAVVVDLPTVEVEGETYQFTKASFKIAGDPTKHFAATAVEDKKLVATILKIEGQTLLVKKA